MRQVESAGAGAGDALVREMIETADILWACFDASLRTSENATPKMALCTPTYQSTLIPSTSHKSMPKRATRPMNFDQRTPVIGDSSSVHTCTRAHGHTCMYDTRAVSIGQGCVPNHGAYRSRSGRRLYEHC